MKKYIVKSLILSCFLFFNFVVYALDPGQSGDGSGGLEGESTSNVPINDYIWILCIIGFVFAFYKFKTIDNHNKIKQFKI